MPDAPLPNAIRRSTLVDISLVLSIAAATAAGAVWTTKITLKQDELQEDLRAVRTTVESTAADQWRSVDMRAWVIQANREVEVWSRAAEQSLGLEPGQFIRFQFPNPQHANGR